MTTVKTKEQSAKGDKQISAELEKFMKEESRLVKGRFRNYEVPGGSLPFHAKKYPNQEVYKQVFMDGGEYEVPLWVARHLNGVDATAKAINGKVKTCAYPVHGFKWDSGQPAPAGYEGGYQNAIIPVQGINKYVQRYGFESLEFNAGVA